MVDGCKRKAEKQTNPFVEANKRFSIGPLNFFIRTLDSCGVGDPPMRRHRMSRPHRTAFFPRVIADSENEVECRSLRRCKFVPRLAPQPRCRYASGCEFLQRLRSHSSRRMTTCAVCGESFRAPRVHDSFCHHRTCRVACAEEENVVVWFHVSCSKSENSKTLV